MRAAAVCRWSAAAERRAAGTLDRATHTGRMVDIVVPIAAADAAGVAAQALQAHAEGADLVEVRLDSCARIAGRHDALPTIVAGLGALALPAILTIRHPSEGGTWDGGEDERAALYAAGDRAGAAWLDCELAHRAQVIPGRPARAKLILSHHDFAGMGGDLPAVVARMRAAGADLAKVAVTPADAADLATIEALYQRGGGPLVAIAMGEHGLPSRLLSGAWGARMTFARLEDGRGSAPGQPTVRELVTVFRVRAQGENTRIFGVIGNPIAHSLSPLIHNAAFAHHGLDAVYVPFLVGDATAFWSACGGWIDGLSITIPHKHALLAAVEDLEPLAKRIGAINTIHRDAAHRAIGSNTDASAAVGCLEHQAGSLTGRRVTILGAGGASRAIAFALADRGALLTIANRGIERARELASEVGGEVVELDRAADVPYDALVNCTPSGMSPNVNESAFPERRHRAGTVVFDTVYTPLETRLLKDAQMAGATTVNGLSMFIRQALGQYRRWTGLDAPEALMYRLALERLGGNEDPTRSNATPAPGARKSTNAVEEALGGGLPPGTGRISRSRG